MSGLRLFIPCFMLNHCFVLGWCSIVHLLALFLVELLKLFYLRQKINVHFHCFFKCLLCDLRLWSFNTATYGLTWGMRWTERALTMYLSDFSTPWKRARLFVKLNTQLPTQVPYLVYLKIRLGWCFIVHFIEQIPSLTCRWGTVTRK